MLRLPNALSWQKPGWADLLLRQIEGWLDLILRRLDSPLVILSIAFAVRLLWIMTVPITEAPDEGAHYWVISFIRDRMSLPTLNDLFKDPGAAYYGPLPPLGYLPSLVVCFFTPGLETAMAARIGNAMAGLATVSAAMFVARKLFPYDRQLALCLPLVVLFHPQLVFVNSYTNNDSTTCAISSWLIALTCLVLREGWQTRYSLGIGVLTGFLLLGKYSGYPILLALFVGLLLGAWVHQLKAKRLMISSLLIAGVSAALSGWWFLRNYCQFPGDVFGLKTMLDLHARAYTEPKALYHFPAVDNANWRNTVFMSFWGLFGNMNRLLPRQIYAVYSLFMLVSMVSIASAFIPIFLPRPTVTNMMRQFVDNNRSEVAVWTFLIVCVVSSFVGLIAASVSINATGSPQGRYLFPSELASIALLIGGLSSLGRRTGPLAVWAFVGFNAWSSFYSWLFLLHLYGLRTRIF